MHQLMTDLNDRSCDKGNLQRDHLIVKKIFKHLSMILIGLWLFTLPRLVVAEELYTYIKGKVLASTEELPQSIVDQYTGKVFWLHNQFGPASEVDVLVGTYTKYILERGGEKYFLFPQFYPIEFEPYVKNIDEKTTIEFFLVNRRNPIHPEEGQDPSP